MERTSAKYRWEQLSYWQTWRGWLAAGVVVTIVAGVVWFRNNSPASVPPEDPEQVVPGGAETDVHLPPAKIAAAGITVEEVRVQSVREQKTVAGTLDYDPSLRLAVTTPVDCLVAAVFVKPGQEVKAGERLVVLVSEEAGKARDEIGRADDELAIQQRAFDNADEILNNVTVLLPQLESLRNRAELEKAFQGKKLGEHREHLFVAYSKFAAAQEIWDESEALVKSGALSGRLAQQRKNDLEVARVAAATQQETTSFEARQARDAAAADVAHAERQVKIAKSRLKTLLGALQIEQLPKESDEGVSSLTVVAPQAGRLEEFVAPRNQRLKASDPILTIGDTSRLWLSAAIHERDWPAAQLAAGESIHFRLPALSQEKYTAVVRFVGSRVNAETRSLPLVAEVDNTKGKLKPGMFAWVDLPIEEARDTLVVPSGTVVYQENQSFVFQELRPGHYRRVDVEVRDNDDKTIEILSGLSAGTRVVVSGAFHLKSELLLEQEE